MLLLGSQNQRTCRSLSRRSFLQIGGSSVLGLSLADWLRCRAQAQVPVTASAKSVIVLWLWGGPAHLDTWDPKPLAPLEVAAKDSDKKIRVKTIKHTDCIEVGHDKFDEVVTNFLGKVGEPNIVSITTLTYTHLDIGSQKLLTDFGVMIVYKG